MVRNQQKKYRRIQKSTKTEFLPLYLSFLFPTHSSNLRNNILISTKFEYILEVEHNNFCIEIDSHNMQNYFTEIKERLCYYLKRLLFKSQYLNFDVHLKHSVFCTECISGYKSAKNRNTVFDKRNLFIFFVQEFTFPRKVTLYMGHSTENGTF